MSFIKNVGQTDPQVQFYSKMSVGTVFVTDYGLTYSLSSSLPHSGKYEMQDRLSHEENNNINSNQKIIKVAIKEKFVKGQPINSVGLEKSNLVVNYFKGHEQNWKSNIQTYDIIDLGEIWQGIDVKLHFKDNTFEKIFHVKSGSDPNDIRIYVKGAEKLSIGNDGELLIHTVLGKFLFTPPIAYQEINGKRNYVEISYSLDDENNQYGFQVGQYDLSYPLVIDPLLASTFVGGGSFDTLEGMIVANNGHVYVTGYTYSSNFPTTVGVYDEDFNGDIDIFISKFDPQLATLLASTFVGGTGKDIANAITLDKEA